MGTEDIVASKKAKKKAKVPSINVVQLAPLALPSPRAKSVPAPIAAHENENDEVTK